MCSSAQGPMNAIRKVQLLIAVCAWPLALVAVFKSHKSPEAILQIVVISLSGAAALCILSARRISRKPYAAHLPVEILIDSAMGTLLIGIYIGGMNMLAKREIREWGYTYKLARGIPQIYANLACLILGILHFHNIAKASFFRYILPQIKSHIGATYFTCPSCARSAYANTGGDLDWRDSHDHQRTTFTQDLHGVYSDSEPEYRPLLREDRRSEEDNKQETGILNIHDRSSHEV